MKSVEEFNESQRKQRED